MIDKLKDINNKILNSCNDDINKYKKHQMIKIILEEDECFFKISIEQAYSILRDLGVGEEDLKSIYLELISK